MSTTLKFWNKQNNNNSSTNGTSNGSNATTNNSNPTNDAKSSKRNWLHSPDALINGHVVYLVKFLGNTSVEQPKGIEVVKDAIRKLQFAQQMKKAETGQQQKLKKVEITVSIDGVAVQEQRTQKILHQYPLHNISYCADEKGVKKFFSFIAKSPVKQPQSNGAVANGHSNGSENGQTQDESHECFVFVSSKLASDITLTIGQAFDLAYKRYMSDTGKTIESSKAQEQNKTLEKAVSVYRNRLRELSEMLQKSELEKILHKLQIRDLLELPKENVIVENGRKSNSESDNEKMLIETSTNKPFMPTVPPRSNLSSQITLDAFKSGGQKMNELLLNSDSDSDFDPRAEENDTNGNKISNDLFGFEPMSISNGNGNSSSHQQFSNNNPTVFSNTTSKHLVNGNSSNSPPSIPPPLLAPPPKAATPRRSNSNSSSNANDVNGNEDLFGSTPFNSKPNTLFNKKMIDDFSLESLDPLRK